MSSVMTDLFIAPSALIVVLLQSLVNLIILSVILSCFDMKIPLKQSVLFSALLALPYLACFYGIQHIHVSSQWLTDLLYSLAIFYNPAYVLLYYAGLRRLFKLSRIRVLAVLSALMSVQYIGALLFLFCQDLIAGIFPSLAGVYPLTIDMLSLAVLALLFFICALFIRAKVKKWNIELPSAFDGPTLSLGRQLTKTVLLHTFVYALLVTCSTLALGGSPVSPTPLRAICYFLLIAGLLLWTLLFICINQIQYIRTKDRSREEYYASLKMANEEFRGVKHDFYNMLQIYDGYLQMQNYEGLQRFHRSLFQATRQAGDSLSALESFKSRMAVYGLLQAKLQKAHNVGVSFYIDMVCDLSGVVLEDLDLCRVLSVGLDNAIEAAEPSEKKLVNLSFQRKEEDTVMMVLSNTTGEDVDTRKIFQPGYTTKFDHAGHGLKQVRRILARYDFCSLHVTYSQNLFTLFLLLHVKN